ncbi:MAG: nickel-dependent lactate racemase [Syntrophales bacterium]|nr:nickel-dependent lactate racemase [Syntrophales bacterium]
MAVLVELPYGKGTVEVRIPGRNLVGVYSPKDVRPVADVREEVIRALKRPIGSKSLRELVKGAGKVVIVADDNTRLTPADKILPVLLDEMNAAGVPDARIAVIIALGTHRPMTPGEILEKFGAGVVRRVAVRNHDYKDPAGLVDLGSTPNGTHVTVNREAYEADFKIGVGSIVPHHIPGYAGGAKIVQPGICGERTTAATHLLSVSAPRSYLGITDNPVREEINGIARRVGLHTILNTVLNRSGEVIEAFFGDVVEAFNEGVRLSQKVYATEIPEEADIVLAGSHPCDIEFWQAHKTLYPSDLAVKAGGIVIVVTPCPEGVAMTHRDILEVTHHDACGLRGMVSCGQLHDEVAAALAIAWAQVKERETVYLVSDGIGGEEAEKLGFTHFTNVQDALDAALRLKGDGARVTVLTHAPDMLPVIAPKEGT